MEISQGIAGEEPFEDSVVEQNDQAGQNIEGHDGGEGVPQGLEVNLVTELAGKGGKFINEF